MDDMMSKMQALLSDPESLQNLQELAAMLQNPEAAQTTGEAVSDTAPMADLPPAADTPNDTPPLDLGKLMAIGQAFAGMQDDETITLLLALKPHLSTGRAERVDKAVKLLRIWGAASVLREQGMLGDLLGGIL